MADMPGTFRPYNVTPPVRRRHKTLYDSAQWRRLAKHIRRRDAMCCICSERPSTQVDHIVALSDGGSERDPSNLQGLCYVCHGIKSRQESDRRNGVDPGPTGGHALG